MYAPIHMTLGDLLLCMRKVCSWGEKMSVDGKPVQGRTRI